MGRNPLEDYLSTNETADYLGVSRSTLFNWRKANRGPAVTIMENRRVMYSRQAVSDYLTAQLSQNN